MSVRLVIADDHALFRQGLKSLLRYESEFDVVAEVERAGEIAGTVTSHACDVLLLDLQMDRSVLNDIDSLAKLVPIVVLTASERVSDALAALRSGAAAIVQKRFAFETLAEAIHAARNGFVWMPPALQAALTASWRSAADERLTARETEIVRCVALGKKNPEIAAELSVSESTVKTHLNNIFKKLGMRDRVELTLHAAQLGLVSR